MRTFVFIALIALTGCTTVESGHMGMLFTISGLHRDKLPPGRYFTFPLFREIEDYDVTFSTRKEVVETTSADKLHLTLNLAVIYRPVVDELYDLHSDIGPQYYDEVVGPEFRSAARGVFARHSFQDLNVKNEQLEDEVERDLRRRTTGKHVEIASVTLEGIQFTDKMRRATEGTILAEMEAQRQQTLLKAEDERQRTQIKAEDERARMKEEAALRQKQKAVDIAKQEAELARVQEQSQAEVALIKVKEEAEETKITAQAKSEEMRLMAKAEAERSKAANQTLTPLAVMMHGYDALKALGGTDTHIMIGDWSKLPNFLFPPAFQGALMRGHTEAQANP